MIEAKDIGELFATMRSYYGHLWAQTSAEDAAIWLRRLGGFSKEDILAATDRMPTMYPKRPPTCGQFEAAIGGRDQWVKSTLIEDNRPSGRMPFAEWKRLNGVT